MTEGPKRGFRRLQWIQRVIEPLRGRLDDEQYTRLQASLAIVAGWESMVVARDVCDLAPDQERTVLRWMAHSLVAAMITEADRARPGSDPLPPTPAPDRSDPVTSG